MKFSKFVSLNEEMKKDWEPGKGNPWQWYKTPKNRKEAQSNLNAIHYEGMLSDKEIEAMGHLPVHYKTYIRSMKQNAERILKTFKEEFELTEVYAGVGSRIIPPIKVKLTNSAMLGMKRVDVAYVHGFLNGNKETIEVSGTPSNKKTYVLKPFEIDKTDMRKLESLYDGSLYVWVYGQDGVIKPKNAADAIKTVENIRRGAELSDFTWSLRESFDITEEMTDAQKKKREEIVLAMKKNKDELQKKHGDGWEGVMYAIATKQAMSEATESKKELEKQLADLQLRYENSSWRMGDKYRAEIAALKKRIADLKESITEAANYPVKHITYSSAVQAAAAYAKAQGYVVDDEDWDNKIATGPKRPSSGKTNSFSIAFDADKSSKPIGKKMLHIQVYNADNKFYELNTYVS